MDGFYKIHPFFKKNNFTKKIIIKMTTLKTFLSASLILVSFVGFSQATINQNISENNGKIRISVSKEENGKKEFFDKTYNTEGLTEIEKQNLIDSVLDSLSLGGGKNIKIKTRIEDNTDRNYNRRDGERKKEVIIKKRNKTIIKGDDDNEEIEMDIEIDDNNFNINGLDFDFKDLEKNMGDLSQTLKFKLNDLEPSLRKLGKDIEPGLKRLSNDLEPSLRKLSEELEPMLKNFELNTSSKTVKSLNAYANKPNNNKLNVEFYVPNKGEVTIIISDLKGKEIGKTVLKDFTGDYLGQIDLNTKAKGTVFVTVTQGEDGTVKRVVLE
jgi:hypothetical protein